MDRTDTELLSAFASGDTGALGLLAERYERGLLGLARGLLRGRADLAVEAVQEAWVRVIRFAGSFASKSEVKTWLYRIVVNQCRTLAAAEWRDSLKKNDRQLRLARENRSESSSGHPATDPVVCVIAREEPASLRTAVSELDAQQRDVLLLCYHADLTHAEAAKILEIPLGTLKSRLHAALEELRGRLSPEESA